MTEEKEMTYKTKETLKAKPKKFPLSSKRYSEANRIADEKEKKKYPKGYEKLKKLEKKIPKDEVLGHINKAGKVTVSKKVPKKLRSEVAEHDIMERKYLLKRRKK